MRPGEAPADQFPTRDALETAIAHVRRGSITAYPLVVESCQRRLRGLVACWCPRWVDADEIAHLAFVQAYEQFDRYEPGSGFSSWVVAIARDLVLGRPRPLRRRALVELHRPDPLIKSGDEAGGFAARVAVALAQDRDRFIGGVMGAIECRARRRQVRRTAAMFFALLWLVTSMLAWRWRTAMTRLERGMPLVGQQAVAGRLAAMQYPENMARLLRRCELRLQEVEHERRLRAIRKAHALQVGRRRSELAALRGWLRELEQERGAIEWDLGGQVVQARSEQAELVRGIERLERRIDAVAAEGRRQVERYHKRFVQASNCGGCILRREPVPRLRLRRTGVVTPAELLASTFDQDEADGRVISGLGQILIEPGTREGLREGQVFLVRSPLPGGYRRYRGRVRVVHAAEEWGRVVLLDGARPEQGDRLASKVFRTRDEMRRRGPVRVAFLGRFPRSRAALPRIRSRLSQAGACVEPRLSHWTTLVVVEADDLAGADYRKAVDDLGVEVLTVDQLRLFLE